MLRRTKIGMLICCQLPPEAINYTEKIIFGIIYKQQFNSFKQTSTPLIHSKRY